MYNPMYSQMPYNPMAPAQQRLAQMEQQYPQFAQQQMNQMGQGYGQPQQQQPMYIKCRAVTSFDEAKAAMIDLDGSLHVFTDTANKRIYTKQINLDGTATLNTYVLDEPVQPTVVKSANESPVSQAVFVQTVNSLQSEIEELKAKFEQRSDTSVQSDANVSRNGKRTKSNDADDAANR